MRGDQIYALILRADFTKKGIEFFTPDYFSQQLGYMNHPKGHVIEPHKHAATHQVIIVSQEVLLVKSGKVRVYLFDDDDLFIQQVIISKGDVILLAGGGHGFEMLEDAELIEIKQGPFQKEQQKIPLFPVYKDTTAE